MQPARKKLIAIDGNSLLFRAFFALPVSIATRSGQTTNAVYGFATMLFKLLKDERPDIVLVAWDRAAPIFRHEAFADYKGHRAEIPAELPGQFPLAKDLLQAMGIASFEIDGFEADDILAKIAKEAPPEGYDVLIVTGDKDALQLIGDHVRVLTTRKGITDTVVYDREAVIERFGVGPEGVPDFLGLKGDSSDNIPGVPGIGDKTASALLKEYGSLDGIYENIDRIAKPKLMESLQANEDQARMSRDLAVLEPEIPIDIDLKAIAAVSPDANGVKEILSRLEFKTLIGRVDGLPGFDGGNLFSAKEPTVQAATVESAPAAAEAEHFLRSAGAGRSAFALSADAETAAVYCADGKCYTGAAGEAPLSKYFSGSEYLKSCHDLKRNIGMARSAGVALAGVVFDTILAAYLLDPGRRSYEIADESAHYLGESPAPSAEDGPPAATAAAVFNLAKDLETRLQKIGLTDLLHDVELPLTSVLARMEEYGAAIDKDVLEVLSREMAGKMNELEGQIYEMAGADFNLSSPQQLSAVLFDKMGLPPSKKGKTGFSTDASVLAKLASDYPIGAKLLAWRELSKLKSTYLDALPKLIDPRTGRIHTTFNQVGTTTGRLASEKPNLQNIPVKGEWGAKIRRAFVAGQDSDIVAADYSQIELRILASLADDRNMLDSFAKGLDIHSATAAEVSGVAIDAVTAELRRLAKAVNFGLVYGMRAYGLSERAGITPSEAEAYISAYFERYAGIRAFLDSVIEQASRDGYVQTVLGRRRYVRELASPDFNTRKQGERFAVNAVIQGSAADIIKLAMVKVDDYLRGRSAKSRMFLQVHDELLFEAFSEEIEELKADVKRLMEGAYELKAPLAVNIGSGKTWGDIEK